MLSDTPKLLGDSGAKAERVGLLREPHIAPLTDYVEKLRIEAGPGAEIPYFDPWDGGIEAVALFLLEAPGAKAVSSGFISRNNPDETAKNMFQLCQAAGIGRKATVLWNVVPWYIGDGKKIRAATPADLENGLKPLPRLLELLPQVKTIVLVGRKAEKARPQICKMKYQVFVSPHPSPLYVNNAPGNREKILSIFQLVRESITEQGA
jgi:uracil-DNA glycosylase